jgi:hypothetical protein
MVPDVAEGDESPAEPIDIDDIDDDACEVMPSASQTGKMYHGVAIMSTPRITRAPARMNWRFERLNDILCDLVFS